MSSSLRTLAIRLPVAARPTTTTLLPAASRALTPLCLARQAPSGLCVASRAVFARRHASDLASSARKAPSPATTTTAASSSSSSTGSTPLDWNTFFKLRLQRRRIQLLFSVVSGLAGSAGGAIMLTSGIAEPLLTQVPLDPFITLGLMVVACGGLGWLLGPIVGSQIFYVMNRRLGPQIRQKESEFLTRVRKNRSDPSNSSAGNPVPDFYGEKIQSVAGYRRWLKDQRAFNKKKTQAFV